jgi:MFS family permease
VSARGYLRTLNPELPRDVWLLQAGGVANSVGNGLTLPFLAIYLHGIRGFSLAAVGLVLAALNGLAIASTPLAGAAADRFGSRSVLSTALGLQALGFAAFPLIGSLWEALVVASVAGFGVGAFLGHSTLLVELSPRDRLHAAYAVRRIADNVGLGLGAGLGGLIAATGRQAFNGLFWANAATSVLFVVLLTFVSAPPRAPAARREGYRAALADGVLLRLLLLNAVLVTAGYGLFDYVLPLYAHEQVALSERAIGAIFLVYTLVIAVVQLPVARALEGRRRMAGCCAVGGLWALTWLLVALAARSPSYVIGAAVLMAAVFPFAVGEAIHGATQRPLVADLAPAALIGRYTALSSTSMRVGMALAPAVGGVALAHSPTALWLGAAAICVAVGGAALLVEPRLPAGARRTPLAQPTAIADSRPTHADSVRVERGGGD